MTKKKSSRLTLYIFVGMGIGLIIGAIFPHVGEQLRPLSQIFIQLIKSIIAPLIFATIVVGIAGHSDLKAVGRMGVKALVYWEIVTTLALFIGLGFDNVLKPGVGVELKGAEAVQLAAKPQKFTDVLIHIFPQSFFQAAAEGEVLQVVIFSIFYAFGLSMLHHKKKVLLDFWRFIRSSPSSAIEIEPATFEAAPFFVELSGRLMDDRRFRIAFRDARNHVLRSSGGYDVIVSEPSNAWISGVSNLFTREFHEAALSRLAPGGLFAQWFHYYSLEPADVKVEIATFLSAFPHVSLWLAPPVGPETGVKNLAADLLLVGSREEQRLDWPRLERAFADAALGPELRSTAVVSNAAALAATWL